MDTHSSSVLHLPSPIDDVPLVPEAPPDASEVSVAQGLVHLGDAGGRSEEDRSVVTDPSDISTTAESVVETPAAPTPAPAAQQRLKRPKNKKRKAKAELVEELEAAKNSEKASSRKVIELREEVESLKSQVDVLKRDVKSLRRQNSSVSKQRDSFSNKISSLEVKNNSFKNEIRNLKANSKSVADAEKASQAADRRAKTVAEQNNRLKDVRTTNIELRKRLAEMGKQISAHKKEIGVLKRDLVAKEREVTGLRHDVDRLERPDRNAERLQQMQLQLQLKEKDLELEKARAKSRQEAATTDFAAKAGVAAFRSSLSEKKAEAKEEAKRKCEEKKLADSRARINNGLNFAGGGGSFFGSNVLQQQLLNARQPVSAQVMPIPPVPVATNNTVIELDREASAANAPATSASSAGALLQAPAAVRRNHGIEVGMHLQQEAASQKNMPAVNLDIFGMLGQLNRIPNLQEQLAQVAQLVSAAPGNQFSAPASARDTPEIGVTETEQSSE